MKSFKNKSLVALLSLALISFVFIVLGFNGLNSAQAATSPSLGMADGYAVLASTYTNTSAGTTINGSIGFTTGPAVAPLGAHTYYGSGAPYATAGTDQGVILSNLASQTCTFTFAPGVSNLSTDTTHGTIGVYAPGVYCSDGAMNIDGPLTLSGNGTYIFRTVGALNSDAGAIITLDGASACDVFWTPTAATTLAANTEFKGTVISDAGITIGANTNWIGRALSFGGTTTSDMDTITVPSCGIVPVPVSTPTPALATLHIIKQVVNNNEGTAIPANFSLHVKSSNLDVVGSPAAGVSAPGTVYSLVSGTYTVSENANSAYIQSFSGDCDSSGNVTLTAGSNKTCTVINTDKVVPIVIVPVITATTTPTSTVTAIITATATPAVVVPGLPKTGLTPNWLSSPWNIIIPIGVVLLALASFMSVLRKKNN